MLAQSSGGASALAILFSLAVLALQIYLIYAIIATREDVKTLKDFLMRDGPVPARTVTAPPPGPYRVIIRAAGSRPKDVERVLMEQSGYARSGARGATRNPGQQIFSTNDRARAEEVQALIQQAGGQAEIQEGSGPRTSPS